jgi:hypothetical protein
MRIIKTTEELSNELIGKNFDKPDFKQQGYAISYQCGCGTNHPLNGSDGCQVVMQERVMGLSIVLECRNGWLTQVDVKGMFSPKCETKWTCTTKLYDEAFPL